MLQLKNVKKDYFVGDTTVHALKDVSVAFRDNEFVSILGPSGCGKTTLLNIIGGLDHYTSGDLFIDNICTKEFSDRDWDTYRNHRIGFIFQSYNLIPHQTILENVELALTIAGMDKKARVQKAKEALDKVGLAGQYNKKPNQLSGGQCQRVAIARALVNEPEILLADEPTGALDTETSIQIMKLIQEIAKEKLVIMVTHNPEIAEEYSTRIIKLLDGNIISDSNKYSPRKNKKAKKESSNKKSKLSFWQAFRLSARNLRSKLKRTLLVCLAGSIGIIGVATVLAVSTGVRGYISSMQNDMLSGNPITVSEETYNLSVLMSDTTFSTKTEAVKNSVEDGYINVDYMMNYIISTSDALSSLKINNDITDDYIEYIKAMPAEYYACIDFDYGIEIKNNLYTNYNLTNQPANQQISLSAVKQIYTSLLEQTDFSNMSSYITALTDSFAQAPSDDDFILGQYEFVTENSKLPSASNEIMLVVNDDSEISDLLLAQLGYYSQEEFFNIIYKETEDSKYNPALDKSKFSYEELMGKTFVWHPNNTVFNKTDESSPLAQISPFTYNAYASESWTNGKELIVTAILKPKDGVSYGSMDSGFYYTSQLTKEILQDSLTSDIVNYLIDNNMSAFNSSAYNGQNIGITYLYNFSYDNVNYTNQVGFLGENANASMAMISGNQNMPKYYTLTLRELGGKNIAGKISIYPTDFTFKDSVTDYLNVWNSDDTIIVDGTELSADQRAEIVYTDNLSIVIDLVNNMINIVTYALVAFTALSLVVSTVMIAIITYVSVIERIKEIGVIRSLGGRKSDVSRLFNAETFIIGGLSGLVGVGITYLITFVLNLIVGSLAGITIANLPILTAIIMIAISIGLTLISGLIPASLAAKKDPVDALRSE